MKHESLDPELYAATMARDNTILMTMEPEFSGAEFVTEVRRQSLLRRVGQFFVHGFLELGGYPPPSEKK